VQINIDATFIGESAKAQEGTEGIIYIVEERGRSRGEIDKLKRLIGKFGKYNVTAFIIMGTGLILFLLTPLLIWLFDFDSDILGALIFLIGLLMWGAGFIVRKVRNDKRAG